MKRDIHGHEQRYKNWKERVKDDGEVGITKKNSDVLLKFIFDFEIGYNISNRNKKGARSYPRLNNLRQRLVQIIKMFESRGIKDITKMTERRVMDFFSDMKSGVIKNQSGKKYNSVPDYVKVFKTFWHWYIKASKKEGKIIGEITEDLDSSSDGDPKFVYITKEQLEKMMPYFDKDEQVCLMFCFDSIIRAPTELLSLKVKDICEQDKRVWVSIPNDISKTFGRKFSLLYCGDELLKYIDRNDLNPDDYLFKNINHVLLNRKLQKVAVQVFKDKETSGGETLGKITLYDLRHSGVIHLRILASKNGKISLEKIRHRGGWTDYKMLNYYTKFIGLDGDIEKEDTLISEDKTKLEREMEQLKRTIFLLAKEQFAKLPERERKEAEKLVYDLKDKN